MRGLVCLALVCGCAAGPPEFQEYDPPALASAPATVPRPEELRAGPLTFEACVQLAFSNNRAIRIAERRVLISRDRERESLATILPKLTFDTAFTSRSNDPGVALSGEDVTTPALTIGEREVATASLSLIVPLYDFGGAANQRRAEQLRTGAAVLDARRTRQELVLAVARAYYRVLEARRIKAVVEESIRAVEDQRRVAADFLDEGLVARNDLLVADVQLAERRQTMIQAEHNIELALAVLGRLIGSEIGTVDEVKDVSESERAEPSLQEVLRVAIDRRPDLAALRKQIEVARAEYKATRAGLRPRIYAFADYNVSSDEFLLNQEWLSGGIALQFPLFDGGTTHARLRRQSREMEEFADVRDDRVDDIVLDVKRAYLLTREARLRLPVARKTIELATENLRMTKDQYAEGLVTTTDVLTEEERLARAKSNYFQALYAHQESYAQLQHATGADAAWPLEDSP